MNEKQILLIKHSWSYASGYAEQVEHHMYRHLAEIAPETKSVFNPKNRNVGQMFSSVITLIVLKFHEPTVLCTDLKAMVNKHPQLSAMSENYDALVIAFLMTMKKMLGPIWTNETREAWTMAFAIINHRMDRSVLKTEKF